MRLAIASFVLISLTPLAAHADDAAEKQIKALQDRNAVLQHELDVLREERNKLMDEQIEQARASDQRQRSLLQQVADLQAEHAAAAREAVLDAARLKARVLELEEQVRAAGGDPAPPPPPPVQDQLVTIHFPDNPLEEVFQFFADITGLKLDIDEDAIQATTVSLRARNVRLGTAVDLVCLNATRDGKPVELNGSIEGDTLRVRAAE